MANTRRTEPHPEVTQELVRELFSYDPETGELTWIKAPKCHSELLGKSPCRMNNRGYFAVGVSGRSYLVHRVIWLWVTGCWPTEVDHVNGVRSDNRWKNLRECNRAENRQNACVQSNNTSGCPGVSYHSRHGKWAARVGLGGERTHLGYFTEYGDAVQAYLTAKAATHTFQPTQRGVNA